MCVDVGELNVDVGISLITSFLVDFSSLPIISKYIFSFINKHNPEIGAEVRDAYITTMSEIYLSNGQTYMENLMRVW